MSRRQAHTPVIDRVEAAAYTISTDSVLVRARGGGRTGIGYTYAGPAAVQVGVLAPEPGGVLRPDRDRPGLGLEVRVADLKPCRVV